MTRVLHLLRWDFAMQARHGFWIAAVFIVVPSLAIVLSVSDETARDILPAAMFLDISMAGNLFMAAIYFFEKREGSLHALAVTPVPTWQWLASKVVSLTIMGTAMCLALVAIKLDLHASWAYVIIATLCLNVLFVLFGFLLAAPSPSFTSYFMRFAPFFGVMELPCLAFFDISSPLYWLLPTQPTLELLRGAFHGMAPARFAAITAVQLAWIALAFALCVRLFHRHVSHRTGGRAR